jgi:hypothetical protein
MGNHYAAMWAPWLLVAAAAALARVERSKGAGAARKWCNAAFAACALTLLFFNPLHPAHYLRPAYAARADAVRALRCVPPGASVSTHDEWFSLVAPANARATIFTTSGVDYLVFADDYPNGMFQSVVRPRLKAAVARRAYSAVCRFGRVKTYRRDAAHTH